MDLAASEDEESVQSHSSEEELKHQTEIPRGSASQLPPQDYVTIESEVIGTKSSQYEIVGDTREVMFLRFILHFLYTQHQGHNIELFSRIGIQKVQEEMGLRRQPKEEGT